MKNEETQAQETVSIANAVTFIDSILAQAPVSRIEDMKAHNLLIGIANEAGKIKGLNEEITALKDAIVAHETTIKSLQEQVEKK